MQVWVIRHSLSLGKFLLNILQWKIYINLWVYVIIQEFFKILKKIKTLILLNIMLQKKHLVICRSGRHITTKTIVFKLGKIQLLQELLVCNPLDHIMFHNGQTLIYILLMKNLHKKMIQD